CDFRFAPPAFLVCGWPRTVRKNLVRVLGVRPRVNMPIKSAYCRTSAGIRVAIPAVTMAQNTFTRRPIVAAFALAILAVPINAAAQVQVPPPERICDAQFEDCRQPILNLINNENLGIDVGFWYMTDARYVNALINRFKAGVPVRVLMDSRANRTYT